MPAIFDATKLAKSNNAFAFDLYGRVSKEQGNLAMSPASVGAALVMTWSGARRRTEEQMRNVLHLDGSQDAVLSDWGSLSRGLQDPARPLKLRIANRLFGDKGYAFDPAYLEKTRSYGAALEPTDFRTGHEPARGRINAWVEQQTERRIQDLLPPGSIDREMRLVLVNAIYFLADWADQFQKRATRDESFKVTATSQKTAPTMHQMGGYRVAQADGVSVLEMPYAGRDAAMLVVLPDRVEGIADVERTLTAAKVDAWTRALAPQNVSVSLPRFEVSPSPSLLLGAGLANLGMADAFDRDRADFTGIANPADPRDRLNIGEVFHKAFVKVDEKGTEAAAATAVTMPRAGCAPAQALEFRADHPFVFIIVDKPTGLVLFIGRVADPTTR